MRVVQQAKVHDHSLEKDDSELEPSLETVTPVDVQKQIDRLQTVFEENRDESQFEIDDFTQQLHSGRTESQWIFHRIRRSIVDVIITRATVAFMLEDYKVMESHVLKAVETAIVLSQTSLYASLLKRCQYLKGVALFYQQRFEEADEAFANAGDCPAAPGISLRDAKQWRRVIKEALQASRPGSSAGPRENFAYPESPYTPGTQMEPPSPFQPRKLTNMLEEVAARELNNNSANRTGASALEQARQTLGKTPLIPQSNSSIYTPDRFRRKVSFAEPTTPRPSLRNSIAINLAFKANRSRAMSNASMQEENILAAFGGGGGGYQSPAATPLTPFQRRRMSFGSSLYEREEFTAGDEMSKKQWVAWERMKRQEDHLFKNDEMRFKRESRRRYEEKMKKEKGVERYERLRDAYRERVMERSMIERGGKAEHVRKAQEKNRRRREEQKRREEQAKTDSSLD